MKQLEKIRHYNLPEHTNNLYKEEAISSIALTKNVASKINELVDAFNNLATEKWEKIQEQDGKIRKAIIYMKDNLLNSIDALLNSKGEQMIDNSVKDYLETLKEELNVLESRINNLLGSVKVGSTTLDAEIIDARVGFDGTKYTNIGESIRKQLSKVCIVSSYNYANVLPDLNDSIYPRYLLNFNSNDTNLPLNLPFESVPEPVMLLDCYYAESYIIQVLTTLGKTYNRYRAGTTWSDWKDGSQIKDVIQAHNYNDLLPDLNNATEKEYMFLFAKGTKAENLPSNMPFDVMPSTFGLLKTYTSKNYKWQEFTINGKLYTRLYAGSTWQEWMDGKDEKYILINSINYQNKLLDVNNAETDKTYILNFANGSTDIPSNLPFTSIPDTLLFLDTHFSESYGYQELKPANNKYLYRRMKAGSWQQWYLVYGNTSADGKESISVDTSKGILKGLKECYSTGIKRLVVEAGTYDVIQEYQTEYGSAYFDDYEGYNTSDNFDKGLWLQDIEIVFSPGAKVVCHYDGQNQYVEDNFSPFAVGNNVVIDGLVLDASGCRYGIHPDYNTGNNQSYMKIINSDLKHFKNSVNEQAIGAGFGVHVNWLIENTIFRSEYNNYVFRVHNNISQEAQSKLTIKNCYIDGAGFFKFNHYGTSIKESTIIVNGCSYVNEPVVDFETSSYQEENMKLIAFNNEVRS